MRNAFPSRQNIHVRKKIEKKIIFAGEKKEETTTTTNLWRNTKIKYIERETELAKGNRTQDI